MIEMPERVWVSPTRQGGLAVSTVPGRAPFFGNEYTRAVPQPQEPTPEAVERAARVLALEDAREWDKPAIREIYQERYHDLARAALRAALTAPA